MATSVENNIKSDAAEFLAGVREEVRKLPRYNAGLSIEYVREHYGLTEVSKLGSNENPYGPSPRVIEAIQRAASEVSLYPESGCETLRGVLAGNLGLAEDRLIFGNGSEELIAVLSHAFLASGDRVITFAPSFGLHIIWPRSVGADVVTIAVDSSYTMHVDDVIQALTPETRMLIFGNPSNPAGSTVTAEDLRSILEHLTPKTLLVFDEAYYEYAVADPTYPDFFAILSQSEIPWIVLRTFSKAYGLAGLRIGYGIASSADLIAQMNSVRSPFNVNRLAQTAAIAALGDMAWVHEGVSKTIVERERVREELQKTGLRIAPSLTNFLFFDAERNALEVAGKLLAKGVIVKGWTEPAFSTHVRVSIGLPASNDHFLKAWVELTY